jgi:phage FluMu protein Com
MTIFPKTVIERGRLLCHNNSSLKEVRMKRVVECPSCETKLQVFDTGKGAKQKCPRCKNEFDINPEKADPATEPAKVAAPEPPQAGEAAKPADQSADSPKQAPEEAPKDAVKDEKDSAAKSAGEQPASDRKPFRKKPLPQTNRPVS